MCIRPANLNQCLKGTLLMPVVGLQWWPEQSPEVENKPVNTYINNIISDRIKFLKKKKKDSEWHT